MCVQRITLHGRIAKLKQNPLRLYFLRPRRTPEVNMPRYWVIAPYENQELFDKVWKFDLENKTISIGWSEAGDVSGMDREELESAVATAYPNSPPPTRGLFVNYDLEVLS
jgi:hypothetical protein